MPKSDDSDAIRARYGRDLFAVGAWLLVVATLALELALVLRLS